MPVQAFEPLAIPRKRLLVLAGLCLLLACYPLLPVNAEAMDLVSFYGLLIGLVPWTHLDLIAVGVFLFAPAVACIIAAVVALRLSCAASISAEPRGNGILGALIAAAALLIVVASAASLLVGEGLFHLPWFLPFVMGALAMTGLLFIALSRLGPARNVLAILCATTMAMALLVFRLPAFFPPRGWRTFTHLGFCTVAGVATGLALSCIKVYRSQRRLAQAFQDAMREP